MAKSKSTISPIKRINIGYTVHLVNVVPLGYTALQ